MGGGARLRGSGAATEPAASPAHRSLSEFSLRSSLDVEFCSLLSFCGTLPCDTPPGSPPDVFSAVSFGVPVLASGAAWHAVSAPPETSASAVSMPASERRMSMSQPYEGLDAAAPRRARARHHYVNVTKEHRWTGLAERSAVPVPLPSDGWTAGIPSRGCW